MLLWSFVVYCSKVFCWCLLKSKHARGTIWNINGLGKTDYKGQIDSIEGWVCGFCIGQGINRIRYGLFCGGSAGGRKGVAA
jgi:hypothetical protein